MGIDSRWENEDGDQLAELLDPGYLVEQFLPQYKAPDFPFLSFVDPYGDTVFNQPQIEQLVLELERLAQTKHAPEIYEHLRRVLKFVRQTRGSVHTYIKFYGD